MDSSDKQTTGAQLVIEALRAEGVEMVFGIPGGTVLPLYDALGRSSIRHVLCRHEQGAAFMAQGFARATGRAGVCLACSGPGATNLVTALADAKADSIPLVAITGQVPRALMGTDAFQEVDIVGVCAPIVKARYLASDPEKLPQVVAEAFATAEGGRPGPVLIDIPKDVQTASVPRRAKYDRAPRTPLPRASESEVQQLADMLEKAQRPVLYVGGGLNRSGAQEALQRLAEAHDIPVAMTLQGLGAIPSEHRLAQGMLGMHGRASTNHLLQRCDLLLAIGVRFDDRATGHAARFCPDARIVHVDIDAREHGKIRRPDLAVLADARDTLERLNEVTRPSPRPAWRQTIEELRRAHPDTACPSVAVARQCMRDLGASLPEQALVTTDVGQHQMWVAQYLPIDRYPQLLTSGGFGTMGFGLPAAIGAAAASPGRTVVCITGDGSLMMNVQELATLAEVGLPVKVIVIDNGGLGLVRQQQRLFFDARCTHSGYAQPSDSLAIARAMGLSAEDWPFQTDRASVSLAEWLARPGPAVMRLPIERDSLVLPMVPPGADNATMIENAPIGDALEPPRRSPRSRIRADVVPRASTRLT